MTQAQLLVPPPLQPMLSPSHRGLLLIISGPSGVGKSTITHAVEKRFPHAVFSVSCTTRPRTTQDREGVDYFFISENEFEDKVRAGDFLEHAGVFGKRYGTPRRWVDQQQHDGKLVILEIDVQGAINVKREKPDAFAIFVLPPSEDELLRRLRARGREDETTIQRRFGAAQHEIAVARSCGVYDRFLVNTVLDETVEEAVSLVRAELLSRGLKVG